LRAQLFPLLAGWVVIGLCAPARAQNSPRTTVYDFSTWTESADTLRDVVVGERITLRAAFLEVGSVTVEVNGVAIAPGAFQVNAHLGTIRFVQDIPAGAVVVVHYRRRPFTLPPVYTLRPTEVSPATPASRSASPPPARSRSNTRAWTGANRPTSWVPLISSSAATFCMKPNTRKP
jgi:hypothetical protein